MRTAKLVRWWHWQLTWLRLRNTTSQPRADQPPALPALRGTSATAPGHAPPGHPPQGHPPHGDTAQVPSHHPLVTPGDWLPP